MFAAFTRPGCASKARRFRPATLLALVALAACQRPESSEKAKDQRPTSAAVTLSVFAAASLQEAFAKLANDFSKDHPGTSIQFNFAGTQQLRIQLEHGAQADVFASADEAHMKALVEQRLVTDPVVFAMNEPVVVVEDASASRLRTFHDLTSAQRLVVGATEVPIGRYTTHILERAAGVYGAAFRQQVEARVVSRELNVKQVLAKVRLGEANAGVVYRTDALAAPQGIAVVDIPREVNVSAVYPIAKVVATRHAAAAAAFIEWVLAPAGQQVLVRAGFSPPPDAGVPSAQ